MSERGLQVTLTILGAVAIVAGTGITKLMAPLMKGTFRKQNASFVANLKRVLEAS